MLFKLNIVCIEQPTLEFAFKFNFENNNNGNMKLYLQQQ